MVFYQPMQEKHTALQQTLETLNPQIDNLKLRIQDLKTHAANDPNKNNATKLAELKAVVIRQEQQMLLGYKRFVPPKLMAKVLSDMFNQNAKIHLIKLDILPVATVLSSKQLKPIYKHGLAVTFTGGYMDTLDYLKKLEALPWHFNWDSLNYQVKQYPIAETTLQVYTLSFDKDWLGV